MCLILRLFKHSFYVASSWNQLPSDFNSSTLHRGFLVESTFEDWEQFLVKNSLKDAIKRGSISFSNWKFKCIIKANKFESES